MTELPRPRPRALVAALLTALLAALTAAAVGGAAQGQGTAAAAAAADRDPAATVAQRRGACATIRLGGKKRAFSKAKMACRKAKRGARRVARSRGKRKPKGFRCASEGKRWKANGVCVHRKRLDRYFSWHPR